MDTTVPQAPIPVVPPEIKLEISGDEANSHELERSSKERMTAWLHALPFLAMFHLPCLAVFWVGWSPVAVTVAVGLYLLRMFAITGFYHRYFSHRTFKTSRAMQFLFALLGNSAAQRGPLWWAAHHRHHHLHSDGHKDVHSPDRKGFVYSHMLWIFEPVNWDRREGYMRDLEMYPELRWLDRHDKIVPLLLLALLTLLGFVLHWYLPHWGTDAAQMAVWGFFISTTCVHHGTFFINSLAHRLGRQRFDTGDTSKNSLLLALITLGEGWHNNHHHYPVSTRQGFYWWELDLTYYGLWLLARLGLIWDLRPVPQDILHKKRIS